MLHDSMKKTFFSAFIDQLYKKNQANSSGVVWLAVGVVVVMLIAIQFRSPLIQVPSIRDSIIFEFVTDTQVAQQFDSQNFWQLRDKLGAVSTYNPLYLDPQSIFEFKEIPDQTIELFEYNASGLQSKELLVMPSDEAAIRNFSSTGKVVYQDAETTITTNQGENSVSILQVYPFEEMPKNNGMIDYRELRQDLTNRLWVTQTVVTVSPNFNFESL